MRPERESRPAVATTEPASISTTTTKITSIVPTTATASETSDRPRVRHKSLTTRNRRTAAQYDALDAAILDVCQLDHPMSVRGVFYRVMSAGVVAKTEQEYGVVQRRVLKLRRDGVLPYPWIADGTRWHLKTASWGSVDQALSDAASSYRRALWHDQDAYVEIWSEKEAISSIVFPVSDEFDVPLMIARGFASESFLWSTAATIRDVGKPTFVYQLGDHDPSGVAAWEHVQRRLRDFAPDADITFERIAVTEEQITSLSLPTRPTKTTDSRARGFRGESVEVDAIPTAVLKGLVQNAIEQHIDQHRLEVTKMVEAGERADLRRWAGVA